MASACLAVMASACLTEQLQLQCPAMSRPPPSYCPSPPKELKGLVPFQGNKGKGRRGDVRQNGALHLQSQNQSLNALNPIIIDVQDCQEDSVLFSLGIAEHCTRRDKIVQYLMSSGSGSNFSQLCDLLGFRACGPLTPEDKLLLRPNMEMLSVDPTGRILFSGSSDEMRNLLSILAEFNLPQVQTLCHGFASPSSKVSLIVPYFDRTRGWARAGNKVSALKFPTETIAPLKSNEAIKTKSLQKKRQKKNTSYNRDIFEKNNFHAFESLLSLLLDKNSDSNSRGTAPAILSLKKLGPKIGPKLAHILTSFSIGIAGTGIAVLLTVACKMPGPSMRVPLSATRVFNTGFGLGLFWLSWAVNGLRDTIVQVFKGSNKLKMKNEEEMALKVERSMRDVLFRAGALVALAALRFA